MEIEHQRVVELCNERSSERYAGIRNCVEMRTGHPMDVPSLAVSSFSAEFFNYLAGASGIIAIVSWLPDARAFASRRLRLALRPPMPLRIDRAPEYRKDGSLSKDSRCEVELASFLYSSTGRFDSDFDRATP